MDLVKCLKRSVKIMKIRYAIEKEIEVSDNLTDEDIDKIIASKQIEENGIAYEYTELEVIEKYGYTSIFHI